MAAPLVHIPRRPDPLGISTPQDVDSQPNMMCCYGIVSRTEVPVEELAQLDATVDNMVQELEESPEPILKPPLAKPPPSQRGSSVGHLPGAAFAPPSEEACDSDADDMFTLPYCASEDDDDEGTQTERYDLKCEEPLDRELISDDEKEGDRLAEARWLQRYDAEVLLDSELISDGEKEEDRLAEARWLQRYGAEEEGCGFVVSDNEATTEESEEEALEVIERALEAKQKGRRNKKKRSLSRTYQETQRRRKQQQHQHLAYDFTLSRSSTAAAAQSSVERTLGIQPKQTQSLLYPSSSSSKLRSSSSREKKKKDRATSETTNRLPQAQAPVPHISKKHKAATRRLFMNTVRDDSLQIRVFPEKSPDAFRRMLVEIAAYVVQHGERPHLERLKNGDYKPDSTDCAFFYIYSISARLRQMTDAAFLKPHPELAQLVRDLSADKVVIKLSGIKGGPDATLTQIRDGSKQLPCPPRFYDYFSVRWFLFTYPVHWERVFSSLLAKYRHKRPSESSVSKIADSLVTRRVCTSQWETYRRAITMQFSWV